METHSPSGAPSRLLARLSPRRVAGPIAALAAAALLAGCGTASSGTGSNASTGKSTTSTNQFNPGLVPAGGSSPGTPPTLPKSKSAQRKSGSKSSRGGKPGAGSTGSSAGGSTGGGSGALSGPTSSGATTRTVTVTHTSTVTHTVTKYVRPDVPSGAGLPSRSAALSVSRFDAERGNIGCRISNGTVRCDVGRRVWSPPHRPASCHSGSSAWGQGLMIGPSGSAFFVCARSSVLDPTGTYIRPGYDDKVGSVTCQVRAFGVTCFETDGHGFFIGRTGYTRF